MTTKMLTAALALRQAGLSLIPSYPKDKSPAWHLLPIPHDEHGRPIINDRTGKPKREWRRYMAAPPTEDEVRSWFTNGRFNIALVCGQVSGNLAVLDFDHDAAELFPKWTASIDPDLNARLTIIETGKGYQVIFRVPAWEGMPSNRILARKPDPDDRIKSGLVLIELLSEGSLCTTAPSWHHARRKHYRAVQGSLLTIPKITPQEAESMIAAAERLTKMETRHADLGGQRVAKTTLAFLSMDERRAAGYAQAAMRNIAGDLADQIAGGRNHRLNEASFWLGRYVGASLLSEQDVAYQLKAACEQNGLITDDGEGSFLATLRSGLEAGAATPITEAEIMDRLATGTVDTSDAIQSVHPPLTDDQTRQVERIVSAVQQDAQWVAFHEGMAAAAREEWRAAGIEEYVVARYLLGATSKPEMTAAGTSIPTGSLTVPFCDEAGNVRDVEFRYGTQYWYHVDELPSIHYVTPFFEDADPNPDAPLVIMMDSVAAYATHLHYGNDLRLAALPHAPLRPDSLRELSGRKAYLLVGSESSTSGRNLPLVASSGIKLIRTPFDTRTLRQSGFTIDDLYQIINP